MIMLEPRKFGQRVLAVLVPVLLGAVIMSLPAQWFGHDATTGTDDITTVPAATPTTTRNGAPLSETPPTPVTGDSLTVAIRQAKQGPTKSVEEFFGTYRLERDQSRSRELESLEKLARDADADPGVRLTAQKQMLALINATERERQIESLLAAEGFQGSLAYTSGQNLTVVVSGRPLDPVLATKVGELAAKTAGVPPQNVVIVEK